MKEDIKNKKITEVEIREVFDSTSFDSFLPFPSTPFTQAFFYGEWQKQSGRNVWRFFVIDGGVCIGIFQIISFGLPFGKCCMYIPYGPVFTKTPSENVLLELKYFLKKFGKKHGAIFVRTDFSFASMFEKSEGDVPLNNQQNIFKEKTNMLGDIFVTPSHATYHASFLQPRLEWYIDLAQDEEKILQAMHKNTRYSIRVAEKNIVNVEIVTKNLNAYFDVFYEVLSETAKRDHFHLHSKKYYQAIFDQCGKGDNAVLVLGSFQGKILAVNLIILYGDTAMFIFGGTRDVNREVMPAYAVQWKTIKFLREQNYKWYNLGGVSDDADKNVSWKGLTAFKKRFGGILVRHSDFYDVVVNPVWYFLYSLYKRVK